MITITEKSPVITHISDESVIKEYLSYKYEWWRQGPFHKIKEEGIFPLVKKGYFLSGFQQRVFDYLDRRGIEYTFEGRDYGIKIQTPELKGIEFRTDQQFALKNMGNARRGVWKAPTGSGKTLLICGLVSAFLTTALVIVHTETLFKQTIEELQRFFKDVGYLGGGLNQEGDIMVAMIQTLVRRGFDPKQWGMVIVDEAHHISSFDGSYGKVLKKILAPIRFGFTATLPKTEKGRMALEGLIGPVIGNTSYEELQEKEVLAKPIVKIYRVPETDRYRELKGGYGNIYQKGIVENRGRNRLIIGKAKELIEQGLTVLIMVERVEHGDILLDMAELIMPGVFHFLYGETDRDFFDRFQGIRKDWLSIREEKRKGLEKKGLSDYKIEKEFKKDKEIEEKKSRMEKEKKQAIIKKGAEGKGGVKARFEQEEVKGVIATRIWSEGVNIKSIGAVINAVGGESEIASIQRFGRGLRKTEGKDEVILVDFIDFNHWWFQKHSLKRMITYLEAEWEISG